MPPAAVRISVLALTIGLVTACAAPASRTPEPNGSDASLPRVFTPVDPSPVSSIGTPVTARSAEVILTEPDVRYRSEISREQREDLRVPFPPQPKKKRPKSMPIDGVEASWDPDLRAARATQTTIESIDVPTNFANTGSLFIPADAHGAAGPNHVVAVTNTSIEFLQKNGTLDLSDSLRNFFSAVSPTTFTFDPKVLYDQYEDRWLIVTLERGDSPEFSSILLAVSDDSNPNGNWTQIRIDSSFVINGNPHWFDYPGFAVDDQAVYITGNMFRYFDGSPQQGSFGGNRLVIVDKGTTGGFYGGGSASVSVIDPAGGGAFAITQQPAHTFGSVPASLGALLVGYTGLSSSATGSEFFQVIRITNPLTAPVVTSTTINAGDFDDAFVPFPDAPQAGLSSAGGSVDVATNDRRTLDAVWRNDGLWFTYSFLPGSGADAGQVTAGWARLDTAVPGTFSVDQLGFAGGEDIASGTFTFFPSIAVNDDGGAILGFSASAPTINVGAYYSYRTPTDDPGTLRPSLVVRSGLDYYQRTFGGPENRWGDYSSAALDPDGACFWVYNKYAINRGLPTTGAGEDGQWGSAFAQFCNDAPVASGDSAEVDQGQTVTRLTTGQSSVLANDSDPDTSDTLVATTSPISGPNFASAFSIDPDGSFSYTHDGSGNLSDAVVYEVCDDGSPIRCATATLQFTIATVANQPPDAAPDAITVSEGGTATTLSGGGASVLGNDSDPEGGMLTVNLPANPPPARAASFSLDPEGTFSYTHDGSETSSDGFGYEVCDDGVPVACSSTTVSITITEVNDPPTGRVDILSEIAEDSGLRPIQTAILLNNDDPGPGEDGQTLMVTGVGASIGGSAVLNGSTIEFTPAPDFAGPASIEYEITDNGTTNGNPDPQTATASAVFVITEVNDPPVADPDVIADMLEDGATRSIPFAALTGNDSAGPQEGNQTLTLTAVGSAVGGTAVQNGQSVDFTPLPDYTGPASFTYEITDDGTTNGAPSPLSDSGSVSFQITPVNDPPVAVPDSYNTNNDRILSGDVSLNDFDIDSPTLTFSVETPPALGSLNLNGDGSFSYTPAAGSSGEVTFVYSVSDSELADTATVTIQITDIVFEDGFETAP